MTATHLVLRAIHIGTASIALLSGAGAMLLRKGSAPHRWSGNVFFVSMLVMTSAALSMALFTSPNAGNVMGGALTFYLVLSAWLTVWREPRETGRLEVVAMVLGAVVAAAGIRWGILAGRAPRGRIDGYPPPLFFIFGGMALFATTLDVRMLARGGFSGVQRTTRHLWRMCLAMLIATASFFIGQAKYFPAAVRQSGVLKIPVFLVIGALFWWLVHVRLWPLLRRLRLPRLTREHS